MDILQSNSYYHFSKMSLLICCTLMIALGVLFIYSAGFDHIEENADPAYIKQLISIIPGIILLLLFNRFHYQRISNFSGFYYISALMLLVMVLLFGTRIHGAKSWFTTQFFSFQPSELAKIALILSLSKYMDICHHKKVSSFKLFLNPLLLSAPFIVLVMIQPDPGTAVIYILITVSILFVGGVRLKYMLALLTVGFLSLIMMFHFNHQLQESRILLEKNPDIKLENRLGVYQYIISENDKQSIRELHEKQTIKLSHTLLTEQKAIKKSIALSLIRIIIALALVLLMIGVFYQLRGSRAAKRIFYAGLILLISISLAIPGIFFFKSHHLTRIVSFVDLSYDPQGMNYNQRQSVMAIGSGGLYGHGLFEGPQNNFNYIPENKTDFIFSVIGEEWGFIRGTGLVLLLYFTLIYQSLMVIYHAKNHLGSMIATGITTLFFSHIAINLGMSIGLLPVMGLPLPFLSAGGSALISHLACIGLLLNISKHRFVH